MPCPSCGADDNERIIEWAGVPTNSSVFFASESDALALPRAHLLLVCCVVCGQLYNATFDAGLPDYARYIETQSTSEHHLAFQRELAQRWIDRYGLADADVVEVGCGHEAPFLHLFCDFSGGTGVGIGPSASRSTDDAHVRFVPELLGPEHVQIPGRALICRHTLEHISDARAFLDLVHEWSSANGHAVVLFEVPDAARILRDVAFWDVYYEHVTYFTIETLTALFDRAGFAIELCDRVFHDQFIVLEAVATNDPRPPRIGADSAVSRARAFGRATASATASFSTALARLAGDGPVVIWQAGSKAVGLLSATDSGRFVTALTDANPDKYGLYLAGSGHPIVAPTELPRIAPAHVVLMNEAYVEEVAAELTSLRLDATLHTAQELLAA